ncbi:hypothetical protein BKN38_07045, partial [Helicobacter sp. CLO-3]|uniref:PDC sensor domain-containing protein n=3 Tax=unclassified Helicobacter TaxID=2593540 RepID=UPI0008DA0941
MLPIFRNLGIGAKIMSFVSVIVVIGILVLSLVVSSQVSTQIKTSAEDIIANASSKYANYIENSFAEIYAITSSGSETLKEMLRLAPLSKSDMPSTFEAVLKSSLDSVTAAKYGYIYLLDSPENFANHNKSFVTSRGNIVLIYEDTDLNNIGGLRLVKADESVVNFPVVQKIVKTAKYGDSVSFGKPFMARVNGVEFEAVNVVAPIFDSNQKLVGVYGFAIDISKISDFMLNPKDTTFEGEVKGFFTQDGSIVAHTLSEYILKNIMDVNNRPESKEAFQAVLNGESDVFDDYITLEGNDSYASVSSFKTQDGSGFSVLVTAPKSSVLAPLYKLELSILVVSLIVLAVILVSVFFYVRIVVISRFPLILKTLDMFFKYINHEGNEVHHIKVHANDELGKIGQIINQNVDKSREHLDRDAELVKESLAAIDHAKNGYATKRITIQGSNPQLNTLKDSVNQLLELLSTGVGNDLHELNRVFDSFVKLDFSTQVANAQGRVEVVTNTLGEEIRKMLKTSLDFANSLNNQ